MLLEVKVKPNNSCFRIKSIDPVVVEIVSPPKEGKANTEIVKEFKKLFNADIKIIKGLKSKNKVVSIDLPEDEVNNKLNQLQL